MILHLGLSALAQGFKLEQIGYNVADFRIPDERGWVARDEVIAAGGPEELATRVPVDELLQELRLLDDRAAVSTDPGRYICNYVYFKSLLWAEQHPEVGCWTPVDACGSTSDMISMLTCRLWCCSCTGPSWTCCRSRTKWPSSRASSSCWPRSETSLTPPTVCIS